MTIRPADPASVGGRHLYRYLTTRLADLPGLQSVETTPMITTVKRVGRWDAAE